jgi:quercetin dioxygenase-like cupin family protein
MFRQFLCAAALTVVSLTAASAQDGSGDKREVTLVYDQVLPNVPGKSIRGVLVEYEPGGFSDAHTHPSSAFIYGPVTTYRAGESWSEQPGDHHLVSANASDTEPARLLAVFVVDTSEKELVYPMSK